jgi:hypothetical protein
MLDPSKIKWSVNAALGTIDASGAFTSGKMPRAGQVIASYDKISTAATVNIWKSPAFLSIVPGSLNLLPGEESQLFVRAFDRANRPVILDPSAVSWSVAGEGVAVDSKGHLVAGSTTGSFIVTATVGETTAHLQGNISLAKPVASQDSSNDSAPAAH